MEGSISITFISLFGVPHHSPISPHTSLTYGSSCRIIHARRYNVLVPDRVHSGVLSLLWVASTWKSDVFISFMPSLIRDGLRIFLGREGQVSRWFRCFLMPSTDHLISTTNMSIISTHNSHGLMSPSSDSTVFMEVSADSIPPLRRQFDERCLICTRLESHKPGQSFAYNKFGSGLKVPRSVKF